MMYCPNDDSGVQLSCLDSWTFFCPKGERRRNLLCHSVNQTAVPPP